MAPNDRAGFVQQFMIKHPVRDACLYMGEASPPNLPPPPDPPDPHFVFAIAPIL